MLICIDAGHGLHTPGKRCLKSLDPRETREWTLNARVADKLQGLLSTYGCATMRVDDVTGEKDVALGDRVLAANKARADLYLSIHHNAGVKGGSGGGIVAFVAPGCQEMSRTVQRAVYTRTVAATGLRGNRAEPKQEASYYVLMFTNMPAVLIECGFMDSTVDTPVILTEAHADKVAQGLCEALAEVYGLAKRGGDARTVQVAVPVLKRGSAGGHVSTLQTLLTDKGFACGVDGSFGPETDKAFRAWQRAVGLDVDGSCGPASWDRLLGG